MKIRMFYIYLAFWQIKMKIKKSLKPYTVHYRDFQNIRLEHCFYAFTLMRLGN